MKNQEKARIILCSIEEKAPIGVNWNFEKEWLAAIIDGLLKIQDFTQKGGNTNEEGY